MKASTHMLKAHEQLRQQSIQEKGALYPHPILPVWLMLGTGSDRFCWVNYLTSLCVMASYVKKYTLTSMAVPTGCEANQFPTTANFELHKTFNDRLPWNKAPFNLKPWGQANTQLHFLFSSSSTTSFPSTDLLLHKRKWVSGLGWTSHSWKLAIEVQEKKNVFKSWT